MSVLVRAPFSVVRENAFEQLLSSDLNRMQALASRELQNLLRSMGKDFGGTPISGLLDDPGFLVPIAASFDMTLGAGSGFAETGASVAADDSKYLVIRWPSQSITFAGADPGNPRIDLVVATPAVAQADPQSRNILVDPTTHTFAPATVEKTSNPLATIAVVTGAALADPVPPAVPAGAIALKEVWVPKLAPDSSSFRDVPRLFRIAQAPWSQMNGIINGARLVWAMGASPILPGFINERNAILIDGEIITFFSIFDSFTFAPFTTGDGNVSNDPTDVANAAPATSDRVFYIYAVGGRHSPQMTGVGGIDPFHTSKTPVALVISLVAPEMATWQPSAPITPPRGGPTTIGAVFVGLGFTEAGSSNSRACLIDGDWIVPAFSTSASFADLASTNGALANLGTAGTAGTPVTIPATALPSVSRACRMGVYVSAAAPAGGRSIQIGSEDVAGVRSPAQMRIHIVGSVTDGETVGEVYFSGGAPQFRVYPPGADADAVSIMEIIGWRHHVPRLDGNAGLASD